MGGVEAVLVSGPRGAGSSAHDPYPAFASDLNQTLLDSSVEFEKFCQHFFQLSHSFALFGV